MKPVENTVPVNTQKRARKIPRHYKCIHCGEADSGKAYYRETRYGVCDLVNLATHEHHNHQLLINDAFQITEYICSSCDTKARVTSELFISCNREGIPIDLDDYNE